jgi:Glycosyltransferase
LSNDFVVLTISRLEPNKRPFDFLKIATLVKEREKSVRFIWAGDGTLRQSVLKVVKEKGLEYVEFVGKVSNSQKEELLRKARVYISTSESEGFSLTVGEAFLRGLPVIVYDLPIYKEVYDDYPITVKRFDLNEFANKILEVLEHPERFQERVEKAKRFVQNNYSVKAIGERATRAISAILDVKNA